MLTRELLPALREKIRVGIKGVPMEEPVDLVFLASVLCNFNPTRVIPHWLVIVCGAGAGKTRLVETIQPWTRFVYTMVTGVTPGFFLSTKKTGKRSPLERMQANRIRMLLSRDATSFTQINKNTMDQVYAQLRDLHDGYLYRETGISNEPMIYNPLPEERLGWIVAATPDWYRFQRAHHDLGSRFSVYYFDGFTDWTSTADLLVLEETSPARDVEVRADMSSAVIQYLELAIAHMKYLPEVVFPRQHAERIAAAVKLTMRMLSAGDRGGDTGKRLYFRSREMACMLAFMDGRKLVTSLDVDVVLRFIFSQMPPESQRFVQFSVLREGEGVTLPELIEYASGKRKVWEGAILRLMDIGVIEQNTKRAFSEGYRYRFTDEALDLVKKVALKVPDGPAPIRHEAPAPTDDLAARIAAEAEEMGLVV